MVIAPDFPLKFAGFFPLENPGKLGKYPVPFGKNQVKNTWFSPLYSPPKWHSSLFHARPPPPLPGPAPIQAQPANQALPPAQRSCISDQIFPSEYSFFWGHTRFSLAWGKIRYKRRKLTCSALKPPCPSRRATQRHTERFAQASCWAFCMSYTMLHKSLQLSQISIHTLTVTPPRGFTTASLALRRSCAVLVLLQRLCGCGASQHATPPIFYTPHLIFYVPHLKFYLLPPKFYIPPPKFYIPPPIFYINLTVVPVMQWTPYRHGPCPNVTWREELCSWTPLPCEDKEGYIECLGGYV